MGQPGNGGEEVKFVPVIETGLGPAATGRTAPLRATATPEEISCTASSSVRLAGGSGADIIQSDLHG